MGHMFVECTMQWNFLSFQDKVARKTDSQRLEQVRGPEHVVVINFDIYET